ncbi:3-beta-hydroxy-Delta(5)-steroid dehydrogenase [Jannaschia pagri]|uniref:3-beta-hydroxy-Delta(5)-steroid dehydrogenase n=1 Tax=Jannaschia pagri TaxID=2829797 RepID=A0ABQ4NLM8_9RHOB|nr:MULTISPECIES: complex I NDUFA9 subunit family protein [unclassified Jannaschia]GIT91479.1 3-beta-hydroxy-Delta(5)-steroid dehydrogenase [Jannaschia sp. AI_61]GIT95313.1 3-beta-hydroxy-Delta(5)-steroid dehydrogenase [Jannaschia sp. AI_62]
MHKLVTIFGGSGFVGRYIARRLAEQGWRVRVAVRRPNEAHFVRVYGAVGQVEPVFANVRDDASVAAALMGADAVVNCVGILAEAGKNRFDAVQAEAPGRIARLAAAEGITGMVQISAIGADAESDSDYARTKAAGEAAVLAHQPDAVILRPSIVFGAEDQFFNRFAGMARLMPILPVVGPNTRFQPVFVDDVAAAAALAVEGKAKPGIYELGGPEIRTFRELMQDMLGVIRRRALILTVPFFAARIMAWGLDLAQTVTAGLLHNGTLTKDQVRNLARDNVASDDVPGFEALGIVPTTMETVLPEYLWRFRRSGQYSDIKKSASNLKT